MTARKGKEGGGKCRHRESEMRHRCLAFDGERMNCMTWRACVDCGAWLPLGPANDEPEAVKVEILAAFLVNPGGFVHVAHKDYHDQDWIDEDYNFDLREDCIGCQAENLARVIATHEGA